MKEIKLRYVGKNLSGKLFIKIFTIQQIEEYEVFRWIKENNIVLSSVKRNRHSGVKDKNGKEIYENDIVKGFYYIFPDDTENENPKKLKILGTIKFINGTFFIRNEINPNIPLAFSDYNIEIIGNIHETPELLESKNES